MIDVPKTRSVPNWPTLRASSLAQESAGTSVRSVCRRRQTAGPQASVQTDTLPLISRWSGS